MTTFNNSGPQHGTVNQVGGNQYISGGQHTTVITLEAARAAVVDLRRVMSGVHIQGQDAIDAWAQLQEMETDIRKPEPEKGWLSRCLERLTRILRRSGALVSGAALITPIQTLAGWLGNLGEPVLQLLGTA